MEIGFFDAFRFLSAVVGIGLDRILSELGHHDDIDYTAGGHHKVHEHEQSVRRIETGEEHDHQDENVHHNQFPFLFSEEQDVVLADDVVGHQAGECEYEEEQCDEIRCETTESEFEHVLEQHGRFEIQRCRCGMIHTGHDDECGHGADDGVDQNSERLGESLGYGVANIGHG